jgi:hypothetical protein
MSNVLLPEDILVNIGKDKIIQKKKKDNDEEDEEF